MDNLEDVKCEKILLHFKYVALILFLMFVFAATGAWTDRDNFTEYLTNAATMISIVLGLVAIFYSFISNTSLSQSLGNISNVATGVEKSNQVVKQFVDQAEKLNQESALNSERMTGISSNIDEQLSSLQLVLQQIDVKWTELQSSISILPTKSDIENAILESKSKESISADKTSQASSSRTRFSQKEVQDFLDACPLIVLVFLHACQQIYSKNLKADLSELAKLTGSFNDLYYMAYLGCCQSFGLLTREWTKDDGYIFRITKMEKHLSEFNIQDDLLSYLESTNNVDQGRADNIRKALKEINEYIERIDSN